MKALVIYSSRLGNTKKVAHAIAEGIGKKCPVKVDTVGNFRAGMLKKYDIFGFGSGIYMMKPSRELMIELKSIPKTKKAAFVFGTSGSGKISSLSILREALSEKGFRVLGDFMCRGFDNWGPLKLFGGINKGRPSEEDLNSARKFGESLPGKL